MKQLLALSLLFLSLNIVSCSNSEEKTKISAPAQDDEQNFFPVTSYLKGQILEIRSGAVNPLRITKQGGRIDSSWLLMEQLDSIFSEFLEPEIDSVNMSAFFKETKFHDKTLNSYTFTYEPKTKIPDSIFLRRWDVYIDPQSGNVRRIFIEKDVPGNRSLQLSWQNKNGSGITWLKQDEKGNSVVEKEEIFKWNFETEQ